MKLREKFLESTKARIRWFSVATGSVGLVVGAMHLIDPVALASSIASVAGFATASVRPAVATIKRADLRFNNGMPGSPVEKIPASDAAHAATLLLSGLDHQAYSLYLPNQVSMRLPSTHTSHHPIDVDEFETNLPSNSGYIGAEGRHSVHIGGTRAALDEDQPAGAYCAVLPITVVYP